MNTAKVAISTDFLTSFAQLPKVQQGKVNKFISNFQKDPMSSSINYEKIITALDPNMRSVRIDQAYRGIVLKPKEGKVFMLLWVDHHDQAYDWAARHRCSINSETGSIQVVETIQSEQIDSVGDIDTYGLPGSFDELKDKELVKLGVPESLLSLVKNVHNELELDSIENRLPIEAYEALFMYMAGTRYDEIINEREHPTSPIDIEDYSTALEREYTKSRFYVADDEVELSKMLDAPLEKWRVFLHPSQNKLVKGNKNGAVRILGGAGTGKTVVALHRAKWLSKQKLNYKKILFVTFTNNLATDISDNLKKICIKEDFNNIEVVSIDKWVNHFLKNIKFGPRILYGNKDLKLWASALSNIDSELGLTNQFYFDEWKRVIQPQNIQSVEEYAKASRIGRGTRLTRPDRYKIWPVFEEYRNALKTHNYIEVDDAYREAAELISKSNDLLPYSSIIIDEAQDMSPQAYQLLRSIVPEGINDLFIAGDGHQRIYGKNKVVLSHCGINIKGRSKKLRVNYRTTEEIRSWAVRLLEGKEIDDLDGGIDTNDGYKSLTHGDFPNINTFNTSNEQSTYLAEYLKSIKDRPINEICIVSRTNSEVEKIEKALNQHGVKTSKIMGDAKEEPNSETVRIATMHRVKGLEFNEIVLASMNEGLVPLESILTKTGDDVEKRQVDLEERALVYVAITRAKTKAKILSYGTKSPYIM